MHTDDFAADAALFAGLRQVWERVDPVPVDLVDRMVAAAAVEDLTREYALLTLVDASELGAVRGDADTSTLQFSDGSTTILLHIAGIGADRRRIDGWVDPAALAVRLVQSDREHAADATDQGRFVFESVPAGLSSMRVVVKDAAGDLRDFQTPQFEV